MILLLGATGLLGHNVLKLLLQKGYRVRVIVREGSVIDQEVLACAAPGQISVVRGSVEDRKLLMSNLWGCGVAVNCSGTTDMSLTHLDDYIPINAELPATLARLMLETGGRTLIHVSSANTVDPGTVDKASDENTAFGGPFAGSLYARSKREGEMRLLEFAENHPDLRTVILLPGFMIGPYDMKPSSGKLLLSAYRKPLMAAPKGGKSFIDVRDVASAVLGAIVNPAARGRYLTTGTSLSLQAFFALQANVCGYKQAFIQLPRKLCLTVGALGDRIESHGHKNMATSRNVRQLLIEEYYDNTRARTELGMDLSPLDGAIRDFFADYERRRNS
ncbi:MAG: NAD-dependent epimerase/dehydratase family protein [Bacteroidales bacterium]|nr:NAD-dependent epimerase/dehydratase family protein [Bacteroidales bacterium]